MTRLQLEGAFTEAAEEDASGVSAPKVGEDGFVHPLGDKKITNKATARAIVSAKSLQEVLEKSQIRLAELSQTESANIQLTLSEVEAAFQEVCNRIGQVKRSGAASAIGQVKELLGSLEKSLKEWRAQYPDNSPIKLDNSPYSFIRRATQG